MPSKGEIEKAEKVAESVLSWMEDHGDIDTDPGNTKRADYLSDLVKIILAARPGYCDVDDLYENERPYSYEAIDELVKKYGYQNSNGAVISAIVEQFDVSNITAVWYLSRYCKRILQAN